MKGTDATVGYVKPLKFTIIAGFQDKPIEIEIYQRNRNEKCTVQIAFNNTNTNDPGINKLSHTGHNINIYLYKEGTGIWSLITSKGHDEKYGEMSVKISNPNTGINITRQDVHLASLPTSNLTTSTYIGFTRDEKDKLASITDSADAVSFTQAKTSGIEIGTITINGTPTKIYQQDNNTTYTAGTGLTLSSGNTFSLTDASNYVKKSIVTNGTDLNTLRTTGFYYQNDAGKTTNNINMPNNKKDAFTLLVESFGANTFTKQTLTFWDRDFLGTVSSETYIRTSHFNNGNWTKWQMIKNNDNIHFLSHNVGDAGYFKFLSLNTVGTYHDQTISFDITHRGSSKTKVEFNFETYQKSGDTTNYWTRISKFYYDGNPIPVYYVQTKDANRDATFDFYVKRNTWDAMGVSDISTSEDNRSGLTVTRYNTFSTSLPSGAVQATLNPYYSPVSHTHSYISTAAGSVGASNLASNAVETAKIKDSAVTSAKIADGTIVN